MHTVINAMIAEIAMTVLNAKLLGSVNIAAVVQIVTNVNVAENVINVVTVIIVTTVVTKLINSIWLTMYNTPKKIMQQSYRIMDWWSDMLYISIVEVVLYFFSYITTYAVSRC